jgi:hypothetical protein
MLGRLRDQEHQGFLKDLARQASPNVDLFLRAILAGLLFGLGLRLDQFALLIGGALVAPPVNPVIGMALGALFGSPRYFTRLLLGLAIAMALAGITAGLAGSLGVPPGVIESTLATKHTLLNPFDFALLLCGSFFLSVAMVRRGGASPPAGAALAYELLLPAAVVVFGLAHRQPGIWRGGALVLGLHLAWSIVMSAFTLLLLGVRPRVMHGRNLLVALTLSTLIGVPAAVSLGGLVISNLPTPAPTSTPSATPRPSATISNTATPSVSPTTPPTATHTPFPSHTLSATATTFPLSVVVVNTAGEGAIVRQLPSTAAQVVGYRNEGDPLEIVAGPQIVDGATWWMVLFTHEGESWLGWMLADLLATPTPTATGTPPTGTPTP